ncbi:MAG TPA: DNA polymerase III subunit delta, partial [Magnetospirillaceae bacterium]|nr:DNA polymerase III subunit delta [Magnetospirillaceae bacterium]
MPRPLVEILAGPETGRRNERIAQVRKECAEAWGAPLEEHRLYAFETDMPRLLALLRNGTLFSTGKLVILFGAEALKSRPDIAALVQYIRSPWEAAKLLLVTEGYGLEKSIEDAVPDGGKTTFWELREEEKEAWVRDYFLGQGLEVEGEAVEALLELVQNNTEALKSECSRLAHCHPKGSAVTSGIVESYIAHNREEDAFSLFDRMAGGNLERSLDTLHAILAGRECTAIGLLGGLLWSFRRLRTLHQALSEGIPWAQTVRAHRIASRRLQATYDSARNLWPLRMCESLIVFGIETDIQIRALGSGYE